MTFLPSVIRAEYRGGFRIHLTFNDLSERTVDFPVRGWKVQSSSHSKTRHISGNSLWMEARSCGRTGPISRPKLSTRPRLIGARLRPPSTYAASARSGPSEAKAQEGGRRRVRA